MKLKKFVLGAVFLVSTVILAACGSSESADLQEEIKKDGKLVVAVSPDYPPFEFKALVNGKDKVVGADIDLAQAIADELGVKLEVSTMSFDNVLASLKNGKADIAISGLSVTEERKNAYTFSDAYYETENAILIRKEDEGKYTSLDQLSGKKVAVQKGSIEENLSKEQLKDSQVVPLTAMGEAINELKSGVVDAVDLEKPVAEGYIAQNKDIALAKIALKVGEGDAKAVAMPKGKESKELQKTVNSIIAKMEKEGTYKQYISDAAKLTGKAVE
ncbi:transporter substrate-binding domain-containing protein [Streptococcus jiangjianxini]|uniref:transporter substrate-binding domain-containing protein n=1 Tax=Streptococcus jiangjianxini TaxID=3161189 RepID=UPI0032EC5F04